MTPADRALQFLTWFATQTSLTDIAISAAEHSNIAAVHLRGTSRDSRGQLKLCWLNTLPEFLSGLSGQDSFDLATGLADANNLNWNSVKNPSAAGASVHSEVTIRVHLVQPPASAQIEIAARRLPKSKPQSFSPETLAQLQMLKEGSVVVAGGTGAGKTTLLQHLLTDLEAAGNRLVAIEDTPELTLGPLSARLLVSPPGSPMEQDGAISGARATVESALIDALRMAPDILVLGEVRTDAGLSGMLSSLLTHRGLATIHAVDGHRAIQRMQRAFGAENIPVDFVIEMAPPSQRLGPKAIYKLLPGQNPTILWKSLDNQESL